MSLDDRAALIGAWQELCVAEVEAGFGDSLTFGSVAPILRKLRDSGRADCRLIDLLGELSVFLDNYVDVNDGDDGRPVPNRAMSLKRDVDEWIERLSR